VVDKSYRYHFGVFFDTFKGLYYETASYDLDNNQINGISSYASSKLIKFIFDVKILVDGFD
jgi:hypothetical protein